MAIQEHPRDLTGAPSPRPRHRLLWLAALCLYALAGVSDMSLHVIHDRRDRSQVVPTDWIVAFSGGLFWPMDLVAELLLAR